mgnify:CR=1 FL=1
MNLSLVALALVGGFGFGMSAMIGLSKRRARRDLRCPTCASETTPHGYGASAALGDDLAEWGSSRDVEEESA